MKCTYEFFLRLAAATIKVLTTISTGTTSTSQFTSVIEVRKVPLRMLTVSPVKPVRLSIHPGNGSCKELATDMIIIIRFSHKKKPKHTYGRSNNCSGNCVHLCFHYILRQRLCKRICVGMITYDAV